MKVTPMRSHSGRLACLCCLFCSAAIVFLAVTGKALPSGPADVIGLGTAGVEQPVPPLRIGIPQDLSPLCFRVSGGKERGLLIDFGELLGGRLGRDVHFIEGGPGRLERLLKSHRIDCIVGVPALRLTPDAEDIIVTPLALQRRIITCPPHPPVESEMDFLNRRILITAYDAAYGAHVQRNGGTVILAESVSDALRRLHEGEADAYVAYSGEVAFSQARRDGISHLKLMGLSLGRIPITIRMQEGNESFRTELTTALVALENEGEIDQLRDKWLGRSLLEKGLWERYANHIWLGVAGALFIAVLVSAWIFTLRRQVFRITGALHSSERRFRELFQGSPDIALLLDQDGGIHFANRVACNVLELPTPAQDQSRALLSALSGEGRERLLSLLRSEGKESGGVLITLHAGSPKARIVEFLAFPTNAGHGGNALVCCLGRDLTIHKRLEKELIDVERLAVIGKTAACVAHEINNPLGIIMANTGVLLEEVEDPVQRRLLENVSRNVERAAATTQRMLKIAMPDEMRKEPQNLRELFEENLDFIGPRLRKVEVDLSGLPPVVLVGDRILLGQLFTNLVLNALNSMEDEGRLCISARELREAPPEAFDQAARQTDLIGLLEARIFSENWLHVEVSDSGKGIRPEHLHQIFDPFFTTRGEQGFGLGLWVSRRIVEIHNGVIYASPKPGGGVTMNMDFAR